jgi:hypothetical protein
MRIADIIRSREGKRVRRVLVLGMHSWRREEDEGIGSLRYLVSLVRERHCGKDCLENTVMVRGKLLVDTMLIHGLIIIAIHDITIFTHVTIEMTVT